MTILLYYMILTKIVLITETQCYTPSRRIVIIHRLAYFIILFLLFIHILHYIYSYGLVNTSEYVEFTHIL